uniref:CSON010633 protein n=1 Tax=Culicoides sonorensis TaxID=179676 RepID=A0A336M5Z3_CULSO
MRIKQGLILFLIICIVVAEISAAKQKSSKKGEKGSKEKGSKEKGSSKEKYVKEGKQKNKDQGKHESKYKEEIKNTKNEEQKIEEEEVQIEEVPIENVEEENVKINEKKSSKKGEKIGKEGKMKNQKKSKKQEEEPAPSDCDCPPGPMGPPGPPGPPGECIYQPVCPESVAIPPGSSCTSTNSASTNESCTQDENINSIPCSCNAECPCAKKAAQATNKYTQDANIPTDIPAIDNKNIFITKSSGVIAIHSQSTIIPECPLGQNKLWDGFSLIKLESNEQNIEIDLGSSGSCIKNFIASTSATCDIEGKCTKGQRNDRSYWLLANGSIGSEPITEETAERLVSRCIVCDVPSAVVAIHSQSNEVPKCPSGWDDLWFGYSYLKDSEQNLAQAGSCLKEFKSPLFIECNPSKGTCNLLESHKSTWLVADMSEPIPLAPDAIKETVEKVQDFIKEEAASIKSDPIIEISRCTVCIKVA